MQLAFIALLQPQLADVLGAAVVGNILVFPVLHGLLLGLIDAADITQQMAADFTQGIVTEQPRLDVDAREAIALGCEARHFGVAQLGADRERLEAAALFHQAFQATPVARRDVHDLGQGVDGRFQLGHLGGCDLERIGRVITCQNDAVSILDQAAVGHDRDDADAIRLTAFEQTVMLPDLQIDQPQRQQGQTE